MANNINKSDFRNNYSKELSSVLEKIEDEFIYENPMPEISPEYFLEYTLSDKDTMLYQVLNTLIDSGLIENIHDEISSDLESSMISAIRPGRKIDYSPDMKLYFKYADIQRQYLHVPLITTDIILVGMLSDNRDTHIKKIFEKRRINFENFFDTVDDYHAATKQLITDLETGEAAKYISGGTENPDDSKNVEQEQASIPQGSTIIALYGIPGLTEDQVLDMKNDVIDKVGKGEATLPFNGIGIENDDGSGVNPLIPMENSLRYLTDLVREAELGHIDQLIGRNEEIENIEKVFARRDCNNVILVGPPSCGKTCLVNGLARMIYDKTAPFSLLDKRIYRLEVSSIMAGSGIRGSFEAKVEQAFKSLRVKNPIVFIDNIDRYASEKKRDEYDLMIAIGDYISNPNIRFILATSQKGYKSFRDDNDSMARKFQRIDIDPLTKEQSITVLEGAKKQYEKYHNVSYSKDIVKLCADLSERYISDIPLPTSAISIMDEVGALKKVGKLSKEDGDNIVKLRNLKEAKREAIKRDDIDKAREIDSELLKTKVLVTEAKDRNKASKRLKITDTDVFNTISQHTNIPVYKITASDKKNILNIENTLKSVVVGQDEAIKLIANAIKRSKVGLYPKNKPIFSGFLVSSSGTGKTLIAKTLAKEIFGDEKYLLRFDMSEYSDKTSVNKLLGAGAGYVGYEDGGLLTEAVKNRKHCVLLFDEIEKADADVYNVFLQILDEGFATDNTGNKVDFKNTIIIFTSNVGSKRASEANSIGFTPNDSILKTDIMKKELKKKFPPEFINRLDEVIFMNQLTDENMKQIVRLELNKLVNRVSEIGHSYKYDDSTVDYLFNKLDKKKEYGARPIARLIRSEIENRITDLILDNEYKTHEFISSVKDGKLSIE